MNRSKRILVVDDEEHNRELLEAMLESFGHEFEIAADGLEALAKIKLDIDLVLLDVMMPGLDGFEVAKRIRKDPAVKDIPIIMVTALSGREDRLRAVESGANDFIAKPVEQMELKVRTESLLKMKQARDDLKDHLEKLEDTVKKRTAALRSALEEVTDSQRKTIQAHHDTIKRLGIAAEYKDEDTALHIFRMSNYCTVLAKGLALPPGDVELLLHASPMHDVGKIGTPDAILLKPSKLTVEEFDIIKEHPEIGSRILNNSDSRLLQAGRIIALSHHEKWDGTGYPKGLAKENIPLWGRIGAVADVFDALTSRRPYKKPFANEKAFEILKEGKGHHFEPRMVDVFLNSMDEVVAIQKQYRENN
ncbi:MAG: response regulator [Desulfobacula sp.]|jgi:putative two-component system response regulator|nr:response regulator [Desulfobacula sp.]MBT6341492.1 response regulator [Desulfobacula sp.]MBT7261695.1 response regulator [Desulfobacula sp.]